MSRLNMDLLIVLSKYKSYLYDSVVVTLTAAATGTEKAFIGNLVATNHLIHLIGMKNPVFVSFEDENSKPNTRPFKNNG